MKRVLLQPFTYGQENRLLLVGLSLALVGCFVQLSTSIRFFSTFQIENVSSQPTFSQILGDFGIATLLLTLALFALGYFINSKTRWIDIFNTVLVAKVLLSPLLLIPLGYLLKKSDELNEIYSIQKQTIGVALTIFLCLALFSIFVILFICFGRYLYQGFKTATHLKKKVHLILFVLLVICVELCTPILTTLY
ncbi:hypothetical protein ACPDHL_06885 [Myroides sp. C15-4]|uniref:hypothetical protein n=1 Tax=Myroides sp. C15-4 TaxID=3400532 RepID=UPI003D2F622E